MEETLGAFIKRKRTERGWNQTEFAAQSGIDRPYLSQIESGKVGLPGATVRRQLAAALGLRHIDILIAAGEITAEEADLPDDVRSPIERRLEPLISQIPNHPNAIALIESSLRNNLEFISSVILDSIEQPRTSEEDEK